MEDPNTSPEIIQLPIITKRCSKCKEEKGLDQFRKNPSCKDNLQAACKECLNTSNKTYYEKNKAKIIKKIMTARHKKARLKREIERLEKQALKNIEANTITNPLTTELNNNMKNVNPPEIAPQS